MLIVEGKAALSVALVVTVDTLEKIVGMKAMPITIVINAPMNISIPVFIFILFMS